MKYIIVLLVVILSNGCTTAPSNFIINAAPSYTDNSLTNSSVNIDVTDFRTRQDILQTNKAGKISYLPAQAPTSSLVKQGLLSSFNQLKPTIRHGFNSNLVKVNIGKMSIKLTQDSFSYNTKTLIELNVTLDSGDKVVNKTFKRTGASKGPLKADIAVMEQDFNQLLYLILNDISQDPQVINYLTL